MGQVRVLRYGAECRLDFGTMHGSEYVHSAAIKGRPSGRPLVFGMPISLAPEDRGLPALSQACGATRPDSIVRMINETALAYEPEQRAAAAAAPKSCQEYPARQPAAWWRSPASSAPGRRRPGPRAGRPFGSPRPDRPGSPAILTDQ